MAWHEISIEVPFEYVEPISYLFDKHGNGLTTELQPNRRVLLRTYLPSTYRQQLAHIEVGIKLVSILEPLGDLNIRSLDDDEDWQNAWKSHFSLLKLGRHLVIKPSWIEYEPEPNDLVIELDPGLAFGTGYHPTTYSCLEALEEFVQAGARALDLGTGSGILSIALAKLGATDIIALDTDPVAVRAAQKNFELTNIEEYVNAAQGTVPHNLTNEGQFDVVVANISSRAVGDRSPSVMAILKPTGVFIASGILKDQHQDAYDAVKQSGFASIEVRHREDWVVLICRP